MPLVINMNKCKSSVVAEYGYDEATKTLRVRYCNGSSYDYYDVSPQTFKAMGQAESVGKFLGTNIRNLKNRRLDNGASETTSRPPESSDDGLAAGLLIGAGVAMFSGTGHAKASEDRSDVESFRGGGGESGGAGATASIEQDSGSNDGGAGSGE